MSDKSIEQDIPVDVDGPPSPSLSINTSDDTINNPMARIYFGPIQSPEKKYVAQAAQYRTPPPVRRSARLSTVPDPERVLSPYASELEEEAVRAVLGEVEEESADYSGEDTPENDRTAQEEMEPSSALATKITRAHDNPSPPPRMQRFEDESALASSSMRLIDISPSPEKQPPRSPARSGLDLPDLPPMPLFSPKPSSTSPHPALEPNSVRSHADLISFDAPPSPSPAGKSPRGATPKQAKVASPSHVVNLLSPSPVRVWSHPVLDRSPTASPGFPGPTSAQKGKAVERGLGPHDYADSQSQGLIDNDAPLLPSPSPSSHLQVPNGEPNSLVEQLLSVATPLPTLRRSPRLSKGSPAAETSTKASPPKHSPRPVSPSRRSPDAAKMAALKRELGSLSPTSNDLLTDLLTTTMELMNQSNESQNIFPPVPSTSEIPATPRRSSSSPQQPPASQKVVTIYDVQRPPPSQSPSRTLGARSPTRPPVNLNDPARTPARRIPIEQAFAQAVKSSQKPSRPPVFGSGMFGPVFTRQALDDPTRSPARRVLLPPGSSSPAKPPPIGSPRRPARSGSAEPQSSLNKGFGVFKPPSRALSDSEVPSPTKMRTMLPFPLRSGATGPASQLPATIPEEREPVASSSKLPRPPLNPSPPKLSLRQPSASSSKIPRIGVKPYARPPQLMKTVHKPPETTTRRVAMQPALKSGRLVQSTSSSGSSLSSSEDLASRTHPHSVSQGASAARLPVSSPLKRKRTEDETSPPVPVPPVALFRQPPTRLLGHKFQSKPIPTIPTLPSGSTTAKRPRVVQVRRVADKALPATVQDSTEVEESKVRQKSPVAQSSKAVEDAAPDPNSLLPSGDDGPTLAESRREFFSPSREPDEIDTHSGDIPSSPAAPSNADDAPSSSTRRTTRSGKTPQIVTDVFGSTQRLPPRRRIQRAAGDSGAFASMSATALKALTNSNTTKNQHYIAVLETEVIRKSGNRPDSPTTKVRTVLEKQKEEKSKGRRERAERRARRGVSEGLEGEEQDSADLSFISSDDAEPLGPDGKPLRHRRGPGDEEDYETPDKSERRIKRIKFGGDGDDDAEGEHGSKRVRWDRGLFRTIYFEEGQPKVSQRAKSVPPASKGALAGSAKALRLDNLGNLINGSSPLKDIVPENIVVKKFVYDNDVLPEENPPSPPPKAVASKGKGKRSKSV